MATDQRKTDEQVRIVSVARDDEAKWLRVEFSNSYTGRYPYVWLRDNCRCRTCYNAQCCQRETLTAHLDPDVEPVFQSLGDGGASLEVVWPQDHHRSSYAASWLNCLRFSESEPDPVRCPNLQVWGAELNDRIPCFDYENLMSSELERYKWLRAVQITGLVLIQGAPRETGVCRKLAEKVAFFRKTIYGEEFKVETRPESGISSLGYTSKYLVVHTDLPYYAHPPEVQLLHCIHQTTGKGAENQFVDGWNIVRQLKEQYPDVYKVLTETPVDYRNAACDDYPFHMKLGRPIIDFDARGELCMRYNDPVRAPYMLMPVDKVRELYKALKVFNQVIYQPQNMVHHKLKEGEIYTFNNRRLLHGRNSFQMDAGSNRLLEGGYIDWDEVRSRMRVMREQLFGDKTL